MTVSGKLFGKGEKTVWLWLSLLIFLLDQGSKYLADEYLTYMQAVELLPVFDLTLVYNSGAAFSFLADAGGWQRWLFSGLALIVSLVLLLWVRSLDSTERLMAIALALILGGATGNLFDRITLGYVIDFISLHYRNYYFPSFNIADSAISLGAAVLVLDMLKPTEKP